MTVQPPLDRNAPRPVAWVTGSSSGIGRAIAIELARANYSVLVHGRRNQVGAEEAAHEVTALGAQSHVILADLSHPDACDAAIDEALRWQGVPHVLVNNAGADVLTGEAAKGSFDEKLQQLWATDVQGTIRIARAVGQQMRTVELATRSAATSESSIAKPGSVNSVSRASRAIINIGWDQAEFGMEGDAGEMFGTIKGAIMAFTRALAKSLAPVVRVNCVAPGWIETQWSADAPAYWQDRARQESLLQRWGKPEDVARVVAFLCTPQAAFVNGQILSVNGGFAGPAREGPA